MTETQPMTVIRRLPGGMRVVDVLTRLADVHDNSTAARTVRHAAGFPERPLPMFWYSRAPNFGDVLSAVIVAHLSNATPVLVSGRYRGKLLAVGSILGRLAERDTVWGSGAIEDRPIEPPAGVRFEAVRGPLTRNLVRADVPETYGDPVILLPRFYSPPAAKRFSLGVVPHYADRAFVHVQDPAVSTIDVFDDWRTVVDRIVECETIVSSSLHGLIVAEAYGIPAAWLSVTDNVRGGGFKFRDYFLSTGREPPQPVAWDELSSAVDRLQAPPPLDAEPLLRAWPSRLTFAREAT
jgi:pyruvyltransferase